MICSISDLKAFVVSSSFTITHKKEVQFSLHGNMHVPAAWYGNCTLWSSWVYIQENNLYFTVFPFSS